jgi:hypothetical protein
MNKIEAIHMYVCMQNTYTQRDIPFISIKGHKELGMEIQCHLVTGLSNQLSPAGMHEAFSFPT